MTELPRIPWSDPDAVVAMARAAYGHGNCGSTWDAVNPIARACYVAAARVQLNALRDFLIEKDEALRVDFCLGRRPTATYPEN